MKRTESTYEAFFGEGASSIVVAVRVDGDGLPLGVSFTCGDAAAPVELPVETLLRAAAATQHLLKECLPPGSDYRQVRACPDHGLYSLYATEGCAKCSELGK